MRKHFLLVTLTLTALSLMRPLCAHTADIQAFILHSYHQEYSWTKRQNSGIVEALTALNKEQDISFSTEYLDTKRVEFSDDYQEFFLQYLKNKYKDYQPDIIFLTDDNGLKFFSRHGKNLFPGVPAVFCGVNDISFIKKNPSEMIYGVFEVKDIAANLQLINRLFPSAEKVTFIGDGSTTYEAIYRQILAAAAEDVPQYSFSFLAHPQLSQLENQLKTTANTVLVLTTIGGFHDEDKNVLPIATTIKRLKSIGDFAIISMEDAYMQEGILGGIVTSGRAQGSAAAILGAKLLAGEDLKKSESYSIGENIPTFDHNELQRLRIDKDNLPETSVILNEPLSIYKEFRYFIIFSLITFIILSILITFLLLSNIRRKRAEKDLKASRNFLNSVLDNLPDLVFVKDAEQLRFVRVNKFAEQFFNSSAKEVIGKSDYDFFDQEEADFFTSTDRKVLTSGQLLDIPSERIQTELGERYLHTKKIPLFDDNNEPTFLLGISRDITREIAADKKRAELEEQLKQSQKMESIGTLAGGIAHDFNNILSSIIGFTELAQRQKDAPPGVTKLLDGTLKGAERAKHLVRQILTFSRKNDQDRKPVILADIVEESLTLLKSTLPSTIEIQRQIDSRDKIFADPTQMHQVIINICTNGYQAMQSSGGTLRLELVKLQDGITPQHETFQEFSMGPCLQLSISDCGKGMPKEVMDRIFDPYFTTKGPESGTGLGLAVVHGIIKSHGGRIEVESRQNIGTTFRVYLPLYDDSEEEQGKAELQDYLHPGSHRGANILLVDDEPDLTKLIKSYLVEYGYRVQPFSDSRLALDHFKEHSEEYAAVITDMTMPNLTGAELAEEILLMNPQTKIILCTGYSENINRNTALSSGISEYLEKPVSVNQMLATLDRVLDED